MNWNDTLKDQFTQIGKLNHYPLNPMLMESQGKILSPQNVSGASKQNSVAASSKTTEVAGDLF